ncbi:hypothetical protein ACLBKS_03525 [Hylemonella sp. W303a]|uniref:hypothetical protein n=1 Tax=Hylemonella sp. W303a TaxID=3389873 RepID=UPI00396AFCF5
MKIITPAFDSKLLSASAEEKIDYFKNKIVRHPRLEQSYNLARECIDFSDKGEIVWIVGPVGVGTSQIGRKLWSDSRHTVSELDEGDISASRSPCIAVTAPDHADRIDTKYWTRLLGDILHAHGDILIDRKMYVLPNQFTLTHPIPYVDPRNRDFDALKYAVISMMQHRQTKLLLINQADRLLPESHPGGCLRSLQILRDLAAQTDARIVLIGSYQLAHAACTRNNWLHRQQTVHLRRYDHKNPQEFKSYAQALINLLAEMPIENRLEALSVEAAKDLCISTVGCVGTLKRALTQAFQHALRTGEKMTEDFILQFAPYNKVALEIAEDARRGERLFLDVSLDEVRNVLNATTAEPTRGIRNGPGKPIPKKATGSPGGISQRRIGERNSSRDPSGGAHDSQHP